MKAKQYSANGMQATSTRERKEILDPVEGESVCQLRPQLYGISRTDQMSGMSTTGIAAWARQPG